MIKEWGDSVKKKHSLHLVLKDTGFMLATLGTATLLSFLLFYIITKNSTNIAIISTNVAMIYILALILIAHNTTGYWYGIIASVVCVICTNFLFTYPYFKLNFTLSGYPITFAEMLAITLITCTTMTHLRNQKEALAERERLLMEAGKEKMRANLLRAISHDLRTPLTSMICSCGTYLENPEQLSDSEKTELVTRLNDDSNWLLNMVENLLTVTRIQNECHQVNKSPEVVEEVVSEAVIRLKKRLPDASFELSVPDNFLMIPMDAMLIEQVIINLLENAVIHSGTTLPIKCIITEEDNYVRFHILDSGNGIAPELLPLIFDGLPPSANSSDSRKGMGIGLSICKTIVTAHGGKISAENHAHGAEFSFTLPKEDIYE